jgi:hypothetical protein
MGALQEALAYLGPVAWDAVPQSSPDELRAYAEEIFSQARLIIETVPEPPAYLNLSLGSVDGSSASSKNLGVVSRSSQIAESQLPSLQKEWGKPINTNNQKENPLNITMYKLNGKDGKGAWFARRSLHEGLPFSRWKAKMQIEMEETLKTREVELKQGKVPSTAIRGIGGDRRFETVEIQDSSHRGVMGRMEVYQLSAQFPGPTTPRDFVTLIMTTDMTSNEGEGDGSELPPCYMIISKPCDHPETPPREGYIRGQYESVELIREIPVKPRKERSSAERAEGRPSMPRATTLSGRIGDRAKAASDLQLPNKGSKDPIVTGRPRGKTESAVQEDEKAENDDDSINPVEWIMITRSDPGGSVPRWMVERGTPKSITGDAAKFLTWASQPDQFGDDVTGDVGEMVESAETQRRGSISSLQTNGRLAGIEGTDVEDKQPDVIETGSKGAKQLDGSIDDSTETDSDEDEDSQPENGMWSSVATIIHNGIESYAPQSVLSYIPGHSPRPSQSASPNVTVPILLADDQDGDRDDATSMASTDSFTSAESNILASVSGDDLAPPNLGQGSSTSLGESAQSQNNTSVVSEGGILPPASEAKAKPTSQEKELAKLAAKKRETETKLGSIRSELEALGAVTTTPKDNGEKSDVESDKVSTNSPAPSQNLEHAQTEAQDQKRIARLSRTEAKLVSQLRKIEAQQIKAANKLESRQRKDVERKEKARSRSEVDDLKKEVEALKAEMRELRGERAKWLEIIGRLQKENTNLAAAESRSSLIALNKEGYGTD